MPKLPDMINALLRRFGFEVITVPDARKGKRSFLGEENIIADLLSKLPVEHKFCVDIGADNGVNMSNTYNLMKRLSWNGLAIECDGGKFSTLAFVYKHAPISLSRIAVTPLNILGILESHGTPLNPGFMNLDIDGYDYDILDKVLSRYRPLLICAEINEKIPPPIKFHIPYNPSYVWGQNHFYGQSISQLHTLCVTYGYSLVKLEYNNAFLVPGEQCPFPALSPELAYRDGYAQRPDRKSLFPWNENMEILQALPPAEAVAFINNFFADYSGKFVCTL